MALLTETLPLARAVGNRPGLIDSLFWMEATALRKGELGKAKMLPHEAPAEPIQGTGLGVSWRLHWLLAGCPWRSGALLSENLALSRRSGARLVVAHTLFGAAASAWSLGQLERTVRLYAAALALSGFEPSMPLDRTDLNMGSPAP